MRKNRRVFHQQRAKFKSAFANVLEIPTDIALNLPRITMIGNLQMVIENHKGIMEYTNNRIRVLVSRGYLEIEGSNLVLRNIQIDEMVINGEIEQVKVAISG